MDDFEKMLRWLVEGTKGGENRLRIIIALSNGPMNTNRLSDYLNLDYKTVSHHLERLEKNNIVEIMGKGYGKNYFLTRETEKNMDIIKEVREKTGVQL
ncbi:Transcriptional regulator containing HTH domain,ArsR family [Candidatus Nanohalococcus occultus]|uniref:Transcriptional regulator containing HTH domain,ArsR family n=3 Tax=Candidatus Nanohalococcus occultus TaxID=2978047 RepID=A0ABY8CIA5_9ARCH|nr:Transcriptional regulator containing HTH domain,ArsR family [Candidatus Nanohaloarchaeota archaeon SVXNc]